MEDKCRIVITRPNALVNAWRSFDVLVDGHKLGEIRGGGSLELFVPPGAHTVSATIDWCGSGDCPFEIKPGQTLHLRVKNGMRYYLLLSIPVIIALSIYSYYSSLDTETPAWVIWLLIGCLLPDLLYLLYYFTIGRKKYLRIDRDPTFSNA
jgi:hypothetical protein